MQEKLLVNLLRRLNVLFASKLLLKERSRLSTVRARASNGSIAIVPVFHLAGSQHLVPRRLPSSATRVARFTQEKKIPWKHIPTSKHIAIMGELNMTTIQIWIKMDLGSVATLKIDVPKMVSNSCKLNHSTTDWSLPHGILIVANTTQSLKLCQEFCLTITYHHL